MVLLLASVIMLALVEGDIKVNSNLDNTEKRVEYEDTIKSDDSNNLKSSDHKAVSNKYINSKAIENRHSFLFLSTY